MLTGRQIREAREMLGLKRGVLARKVGNIAGIDILRAEQAEDEVTLSPKQATALQAAFEAAGIEFSTSDRGARLRRTTSPPPEASRR